MINKLTSKGRAMKGIMAAIIMVCMMMIGTVTASAAVKRIGSDANVLNGYYVLVPACAPTRALSISKGSRKNGANAYLYTYLDKEKQVYYIQSVAGEEGAYRIINKRSGKAIEIKGGSRRNKANIYQNKKRSTNSQYWFITEKSGGYVIQSSLASRKVMTVAKSRNANKANVYSYNYKGLKGQIWKLIPYGTEQEAKINLKLGKYKPAEEEEPLQIAAEESSSSQTTTTASSGVKTRKYANATINGRKTLMTYLQNAMVPCGRTLYIWGGGWDDSDASIIGYQAKWEKFFNAHATASYNYKNYRYSYGNGLDCSGFAAWTLYNTLYTANGKGWLVYQSTTVASKYAEKGWAKLSTYSSDRTFKPGDVVSMNGHVWISLGQCSDGSVLLVHSSPRGVQISGTEGKAAALARSYMSKYFPEWPYEARTVTNSYLSYVGKARWKTSGAGSIMRDPEGIQNMSAEEVMRKILGPA